MTGPWASRPVPATEHRPRSTFAGSHEQHDQLSLRGVRIFNQSRTATPPQINVLSTMILLVSITILAAGTAWGAYRERN